MRMRIAKLNRKFDRNIIIIYNRIMSRDENKHAVQSPVDHRYLPTASY